MKAVFVFAALCASVLADGNNGATLHGFDDLSVGLGKLGFDNIVPQVVKYSKNTQPHPASHKQTVAYPAGNPVNSGYNNHNNPGYSNTHDVHNNPSYNKPTYSNPGYSAPTYSNQGYKQPVHSNQGYNSQPVRSIQGYNSVPVQGYNSVPVHSNQGYNNVPVHRNQGYNNQPVHVDKHPYTPIQLPSYPLPTFGNKQAGVTYNKQPLYHATGPKTYQTPVTSHNQHRAYPSTGYNQHQASPLVNNHQNYVNQKQPYSGNINLPSFPTQVQNYPQIYRGPGSKRPTYTNHVHNQPPHYPKLVYNSNPIYKNQHNSNPLTNYQNTGYNKAPVHNTGYHAPSYNNNNGYRAPTYNNNNRYHAPTQSNNNGYKATPTYRANGYNNAPSYHQTASHPHQAAAHKKFDPNNYSVSFNTAFKPQAYNNYKSSNYKNQYRIKPKVYTIKPAAHQQGYQNTHPTGYQNTHPTGYQNTNPHGYQNTNAQPAGYQASHPAVYQNTHQTGYQPAHATGYQPSHQAAYPSHNTAYNNANQVVSYPHPTGYPASQQNGYPRTHG